MQFGLENIREDCQVLIIRKSRRSFAYFKSSGGVGLIRCLYGFVHQGNGGGMEGTDVGGTAGVGNYASRYAHGYGVFVESGCDDSSDSDNGSIVNVDVANDFHAVGQTNPMPDSGVVKNMVLNVMGQSHKNSDRNVAVDAYTAVWIDNNRAVVAYHQPRAYVCLPRNLEAVFDRVVPQGYAA